MATPTTVSLTSQKTAWGVIQRAIRNTLSTNSTALQNQAKQDLQTQAAAVTDSAALQLVSDQLNGPVTGYKIPTEFELYVPLRAIMQQSSMYPCANDPFNGDKEPYNPLANLTLTLQGSPASSPPTDPHFNYVVQRLMYLSLHPEFVNDLSGYTNYSDIYLEDEALADLEKKVVSTIDSYLNAADMKQWLATAWKLQKAGPTSPPTPLLIEPAISKDLHDQVRAWLSLNTTDTLIDTIAGNYITSLTGPHSTVFPPPAGKTFLENLSALLYGNIRGEFSPALVDADSVSGAPNSGKNLTTLQRILKNNSGLHKTTMVNSMSLVQVGIDDTLFQQLAGLGIQGMLLADIYDYEKALDFQQTTTPMLNSFAQYLSFTTAANNDASMTSQALLNAEGLLNVYYGNWEEAKAYIDEGQQGGGSGSNNINTQMYQTFNGTGTTQNEAYLNYLIVGAGTTPGQVTVAQDLATNVSVLLAGLNYIAQTSLVEQPTLNNVNQLVSTINTQVLSDVKQLQSAFVSYAADMTSWLSNEQLYEANNDVVQAQMNVGSDVLSVQQAVSKPLAS